MAPLASIASGPSAENLPARYRLPQGSARVEQPAKRWRLVGSVARATGEEAGALLRELSNGNGSLSEAWVGMRYDKVGR